MAAFTRFEDIQAWTMARVLTNEIYAASSTGAFARDFGLKDQMRRASVSIMSNIAEGFERSGNKEFVQFLYHAKGSCGELRSQLYTAFDQKYVSEKQFNSLFDTTQVIGGALGGLIAYLNKTSLQGSKYKNRIESTKKPANLEP